jgi:ABC-2 type transport system ATP-binding protein
MAGARAYEKGKCSLAGYGMMRRKRVVLPHTMYIGSTNMLFTNMKVLEYLMFATSKGGEDALDRQQRILDRLIAVGLDHVTLTPVGLLSPQERAVVTLFCAMFSQCRLFVVNLPRLVYDAALVKAMANIAELIRNEGKALVITTEYFELAQAVSTGILLVQDGGVKYRGPLSDFLTRYDKVAFTIECEDAEGLLPRLRAALPAYKFHCDKTRRDMILAFDITGKGSAEKFFAAIGKLGVVPRAVLRNERNLGNAYRGFLGEYDL